MELVIIMKFVKKLITRAKSGDYRLDLVPVKYHAQMIKLLNDIRSNNYSYNYVLYEFIMYNDYSLHNHEFFKTCMMVY